VRRQSREDVTPALGPSPNTEETDVSTLDGKVALVTGGGSGIGRGTCLRLAQEGASVAVVDIRMEDANETVKLIESQGGRACALRANVADLDQMINAVAACVSTFGRLDIAVANAGIYRVGSLLEMSPDDFRTQVDVNMTGVFFTVRAAAAQIIKGGEGGRIVCISSEAALHTGARVWGYSATKAAVKMMVRGWAQELGQHGITINSIGPGLIDTPLAHFQVGDEGGELNAVVARRRPAGRVGTPADIAGMVAFLCGPDATYITGSYFLVDGGERDAPGIAAFPEAAREERRALIAANKERDRETQSLLEERESNTPR
jgi:NAD(P)-dependent dehydrogenase (short-subunit alcohol dehydrogenase family)